MRHDHRRILATGIARLRAKIKYRPVVFELMPPPFTLLQLQRAVEALAGRLLHKQNFRRLIEQQGLVEETGESADRRPAAARPSCSASAATWCSNGPVAGSKLPLARPGPDQPAPRRRIHLLTSLYSSLALDVMLMNEHKERCPMSHADRPRGPHRTAL